MQRSVDLFPEVAPLRQASRQLVRELGFLDHKLDDAGLTHSQVHALIELDRRGVMTGRDLAAVLNLDKSTMSRALTALGNAGLISERPGKGDRRLRPLALTASGQRKVTEIHRRANHQVQAALEAMGPDERATVQRGMELYARALARLRAQEEYAIRRIAKRDDPAMAAIIRAVMTELGASGPGFAIHDPEVDAMSAAYRRPAHDYFVLERDGEVVGGAGFGPLTGADDGVCELRKMYYLPEARGSGMGARMLAHVLQAAREAGHRTCYLETLRSMTQARRLYEAFGFQPIDGPMGSTGHFSCDAWYVLPLAER